MSTLGRVFSANLFVAATVGAAVAQKVPTRLGDCTLDWVVSGDDFMRIAAELAGPDVSNAEPYTDLDADADCDLADVAAFARVFTGPLVLSIPCAADAEDGTELNRQTWLANGYAGTDLNWLGTSGAQRCEMGLRFSVPALAQGETFAFARLILPATGYGQVNTSVRLRIVGIDQDSPPAFSASSRPSQRPKTTAYAEWLPEQDWPETAEAFDCNPLWRHTPDVAAIVNEIVARPGWGTDQAGKVLAFALEDTGSSSTNYLAMQDYRQVGSPCPGVIAPRLELYRTAASTLVGDVLLTRPTPTSITLNALAHATLEAYVQYGERGAGTDGRGQRSTGIVAYPGDVPIVITLDGLSPDTLYEYALSLRAPGAAEYTTLPSQTFRTPRAPGEEFVFTVSADSHLYDWVAKTDSVSLYRRTLGNIAADTPDFHIDLGDTFMSEFNHDRDTLLEREHSGDVLDLEESFERHLLQRTFFDVVCHAAPLFMAIGNHEGEQGWRLDGTPNNVAVWATLARKQLYPLPEPNAYYSGSATAEPFCGLRQNYYAWTWGDALFVVLDPFWYTTVKPHNHGGIPGSNNNWDWTLGADQHAWLVHTLETSSAEYKFVFIHHVTGGVVTYGRGGAEAASHTLGGRGSFEWGGEDLSGDDVFDRERAGWVAPTHTLMVANGVTIFFHAHDHVFVRQSLDGVAYQLVPQPSDSDYSSGFFRDGLYLTGDKVNNSGHLRVHVGTTAVTVDYVRAWLPGEGINGEVAYTYSIAAPR